MTAQLVAKIWWQAPHEAFLERLVFADQVVTFGRSSGADIRIGHAPVYDQDVPRLWGEISWHRGRLHVSNISDKWGFDLVPPASATHAGRVQVPPGASASATSRQFQIVAEAPGAHHVLNVFCAATTAVPGLDSPSGDPASFIAFTLTPTQRRIGAAILSPLHAGRGRRASYQEVATATHYAMRTVRENVAAMDGLFMIHNLTAPDTTADALDRVALTLTRHANLIH